MSRATRTVLVLSDPHVVVGEGDGLARLTAGLATVTGAGVGADALVLCGDLADRGEPEAYRLVGDRLGPAAVALGAEPVVLAGNHDDVGALRAAFLEGGPVDRVVEVDGLRLVVADTVVAGADHGELGPERLAWLREALAEPAPEGTLLLLHHPPLRCALPFLDDLTLRDADALADVLRGTDVGMVVAGHFHSSMAGAVAGIPVVVCPSLAPELDPLRGEGTVDRPGALRVDLVGGRWVAAALPVQAHA